MISRLRLITGVSTPFLLIVLIVFGNIFARVFVPLEMVSTIALIAAVSLGITLLAARKPISVPPVIRVLAGLWMVMVITTLFARNREYAAVETLLWLSIIAIFWAATFMDVQKLEQLVFAMLAAYAALALMQTVWSLVQGGFDTLPRPPAATPNPNNVGAAMLLAIALALWRKRWFWLSVFCLALIVSGARSSLGGLVIGAVVYFIASRFVGAGLRPHQTASAQVGASQPRPYVLIGVGILGLLVLVPILASQMIHPTHGTLALRLDLWRAALLAFRDDPLTGLGPQNYEYAFIEYSQLVHETVHQHAHNLVLEAAATMGIPGLIALGGLVFVLIRGVLAMPQGGGRRRAVAAGSLLAALLAQGMLEYVYWVAASIWLAMLAGWVLANAPDAPHVITQRERIGTAAVWIVGLILIFVLPFVAWQPFLLCIGLAVGFYVTGSKHS